MPARPLPIRRCRPLVALGICLGATTLPALAADNLAAPHMSPAEADAPRDPLDIVRERLAARLGAMQPPGVPNPNVVRVVSRASVAAAADAAPRRSAARVAHGAPNAHVARRPDATPSAQSAALADPHGWSYAGSACPDTWGRLGPESAACAGGTRQSPIDIRDGIKVDLDAVRFDYRPSAFSVADNGHTVQVDVGPGNAVDVMGRRFDLVEFHFHRPSEERIDGRQFDMVVHLVHKDQEGRLAIVAVLLERGSAQPVVQAVWNNLPLEKGDVLAARTLLDPAALLPAERGYYTYMGSLTTPPCSEGVLWMVMKNPVAVSPQQIDIFARLYPMNARPLQSAGGRLIKESN